MRRPRLNVLRTFDVAGRELSFSLAAQQLNISQAAVSQQMRHLEDYLDTDLFVRHHRRLSLTGTGQAYLDTVSEALDRLDSVTDQLFPDRPYQSVTLRCSSSVATLWLAPRLGAFQKSHPGIDLNIRTLDQNYGEAGLSGADLEIFVLREGATDLQSGTLLTSTIAPVCSPELLDRDSGPGAPVDVLAFELIHVFGYDDDWHRWFRRFELHDTAVPRGLSVDSSLIAIDAAMRGDGVMLGRRPFIDSHLRSGELVEVFTEPFHLYADYRLRQRPRTHGRRACEMVASWLTELAAWSLD